MQCFTGKVLLLCMFRQSVDAVEAGRTDIEPALDRAAELPGIV